jgi:hypothetical protein
VLATIRNEIVLLAILCLAGLVSYLVRLHSVWHLAWLSANSSKAFRCAMPLSLCEIPVVLLDPRCPGRRASSGTGATQRKQPRRDCDCFIFRIQGTRFLTWVGNGDSRIAATTPAVVLASAATGCLTISAPSSACHMAKARVGGDKTDAVAPSRKNTDSRVQTRTRTM